MNERENSFIRAAEVVTLHNVPKGHAYQIIRELNSKLKEIVGFDTVWIMQIVEIRLYCDNQMTTKISKKPKN